MSKKVNWIAGIIGGLLGLMAVLSFIIAVVKGCDEANTDIPKIQVYINDNDSIVNQLQVDVEKLSKLLEKMEKDSIIVTVSKTKRADSDGKK